jgi:hypothetical protein
MIVMKTLLVTLLTLLIWESYSLGQVPTALGTPDSATAQTVAGTTLLHFGMVDDGVFKGSKPRTEADYRFLQSKNIKYILDLELLPSLRHSERKKAQRFGIALIQTRINASPFSPSEEHIERILALVRNRRYQPIYFHCALGRDRTSLIAGLYKMYFLGMSQGDAWRYMKDSGYKDGWIRSGLKRYLEKHPDPPPALLSSQKVR